MSRARRPPRTAPARRPPSVAADDLRRLQELVHADPHRVLGAHAVRGGMVVRAWRPDADAVTLLPGDGDPVPMERVAGTALFQAWLPGRTAPLRYRLRLRQPGGPRARTRTIQDPYRFWPTVGELDLHLFAEGSHHHLYRCLGAHARRIDGVPGVSFAVWAPNARGVSVVGDFNDWDGRIHPLRVLGQSGVWELFVPQAKPGDHYKYELRTPSGRLLLKADPYGQATDVPPGQASRVHRSRYRFGDGQWMRQRAKGDPFHAPLSIYELHLGSWRWPPGATEAPGYRALAPQLAAYVREMGFTHVELMPVMEHPFGGSWGYQVSGYYAPTARYGSPDDLRHLIDTLHQAGIGVILDWVPAHFPQDAFALGRFDDTALYEHLDPRLGLHPDWGTYIFNYRRPEVRNFLLANALFWLEEFHVDGLRLDAVASMLYLDYSREPGAWQPNEYGGRENLAAMDFLRRLNEAAHERFPGVMMIAEESTAWPGVSRPVYAGGLGFGFKWNMGWMHDTLQYFDKEPIHRRFHHKELTFGLVYAWSENFILPFSHDEVVHGKGSMIGKMPGDPWQKFANLRALYGHMWAHPGRKMLFMGSEFGQWREWNHDGPLDWHLLQHPEHAGLQRLVRDLNAHYRAQSPLWATDIEPASFQWLDGDSADENVLAYLRLDTARGRALVCVCNLAPVPRHAYRLPLPKAGMYAELLNTDAADYGGSGLGNLGAVEARAEPHRGQPCSALMVLPPLATVWLAVP